MTKRIRFKNRNRSEFYRQAKQGVERHLSIAGRTPYADRRLALKAGVFATTAALAYLSILTESLSAPALLPLALVFGLSCLFLLINVAHDAVHDALTPNRRINRLVYTVLFALIGVDGRLWRMRHVKSHHVFPNVLGCDADIDHNGLIRLSPHHPRRWYHRAQHVYGPVLYLLVNLHSIFVQDLVYLFKRRLANMEDIRHSFWNYAQFFTLKLAYFALVLGAPLLLTDLPWWQVLLGYLAMTAIVSLVFVFLLIGTHFARGTAFPALDQEGRLPFDWATHAVVTALDWSTRSRLVNFLVGGTNTHVAHHLFPTVSHVHYPEIDPIIKTAALQHDLDIRETNLFGMIRSHIGFLRDLGHYDSGCPKKNENYQAGPSALRESSLSGSLGGAAPSEGIGAPWARSSRAS